MPANFKNSLTSIDAFETALRRRVQDQDNVQLTDTEIEMRMARYLRIKPPRSTVPLGIGLPLSSSG